MTLEEVFKEALTMRPHERWHQWLADGAECHDFPSLPESAGDAPLRYCARCWTVFTSTSKIPVNMPVQPDLSAAELRDGDYLCVLKFHGLDADESKELSWAQVVMLKTLEEYYFSLLKTSLGSEAASKRRVLTRNEVTRLHKTNVRASQIIPGPTEPQ